MHTATNRPLTSSHFIVAVTLLIMTVMFLQSPPAFGGTYEVLSCGTPLPHAPEAAGWTVETNDAATASHLACRSPFLTISASQYASHVRGSRAGLRWSAAPGTSVVGYALEQDVYAPGVSLTWSWDYTMQFIDVATGGKLLVNYCRSPSSSCITQSGHVEDDLGGHKARSVYVGVECARDLPANCPVGNTGTVTVKSARFTVEDSEPPRITTPPIGELVSSSSIASGIADVRFSATDVGGGLYKATIEIDGSPVYTSAIDAAVGECQLPFRHPAPCPDAAVAALTYDTSRLPDGPHSVRLLVTDATGTNLARYGPVEIITVNGNPPSSDRLQAIRCPADTPAIRIQPKRRQVDFGRPIQLTGRARYATPGTMMALAGSAPQGISVITPVGAKGTFRAKVRPLESQTIRAVLLTPGGAPQCSRAVPIEVRAKSTARAMRERLRNREALRLTGRVLGNRLPASGTTVVVRVRGAGSKRWFKAGTVRSDPSGRWNWRYRFRRTTRRTTYIFQARVPRQRLLPYAEGHSRSVRVTVVP